jgi:DNA-binding transcriptional regulator YiaG
MSKKTCPVCGSQELTEQKKEEYIEEPFGGQELVEIKEYYCSACGSSGDLFNENDEIVENAYDVLKKQSVNNILDTFAQNKISMSAMERALNIPQRTFTKWKNGNAMPSSTGIALLRCLRLFPWLLEVAENAYDYDIAQKIHIQSAVQTLFSKVEFEEGSISDAGLVTTAKTAFFYMQYNKDEKKENEPIYATSDEGTIEVRENETIYIEAV